MYGLIIYIIHIYCNIAALFMVRYSDARPTCSESIPSTIVKCSGNKDDHHCNAECNKQHPKNLQPRGDCVLDGLGQSYYCLCKWYCH